MQRSSGVKFLTTSDLHEWHIILPCTFQKCTLLLHFDIRFEKITSKRICPLIVKLEVHLCKLLIFLIKNQ